MDRHETGTEGINIRDALKKERHKPILLAYRLKQWTDTEVDEAILRAAEEGKDNDVSDPFEQYGQIHVHLVA
jgi:hypothetical protein